MAGLRLPNNVVKVFSAEAVAADNQSVSFPDGTTFSSFTSDPNAATAVSDPATGETTVTPNPAVTSIVLVTIVATLPGDGGDISGVIDLHFVEPASVPGPVPVRIVVSPEE
jgi:hypothetical protein